ncbi:MAG: DNA-binding response OmpR family regulator [Bacteriovoracaceae bacterium]|jgi:two-component system alkaline phosphatase synthesis response regulator PhoP
MSEKIKILVVEDEKHIAEGLKLNLSRQGYDVLLCHNGIKALELWKSYTPSLIILDLMLPGLDGFKVLENIRLYDERLPILILSARDAVEDKIRCLKKGVDDYLAKPFDLDEFLLRVDRILKRSEWSKETEIENKFPGKVEFGDCWVDFDSQIGHGFNGEITLTLQELKLLKIFYQNQGRVLSRKFLLEHAFGYSLDVSSRTVDNFIVRLRKYFEEDPKKPRHFKSKRAMGYVFEVS